MNKENNILLFRLALIKSRKHIEPADIKTIIHNIIPQFNFDSRHDNMSVFTCVVIMSLLILFPNYPY